MAYPRGDEEVIVPPEASASGEFAVDPHRQPDGGNAAEAPKRKVDLRTVVILGLRGYYHHHIVDGGVLQHIAAY